MNCDAMHRGVCVHANAKQAIITTHTPVFLEHKATHCMLQNKAAHCMLQRVLSAYKSEQSVDVHRYIVEDAHQWHTQALQP